MFEKIKNAENQKMTAIKYLKNSNMPLLLMGAGSYARDIMLFCNRHNIQINHVVLDKSYYEPNRQYHNRNVELLDNVLMQYDKVNIILAFATYRDKMREFERNSKINRSFFIDAPHEVYDDFFDYEFVMQNKAKFEESYNMLEDDYSKNIFIAHINSMISQQPDELVKLNNDELIYFPDIFTFNDYEIFIDCGSFDGQTTDDFIQRVDGKYNSVYAFEPDKQNLVKLKNKMAHYKNIQIIEKGCYSKSDVFYFSAKGTSTSMIIHNSTNGERIEVETIDNIVPDHKATFIKMDIEGSELEALKGAKNTIAQSTPKLAISAYHKPEDLITIPQYIQSVNKNYKFYLRHYGYVSWETVLYAVPN
jgi:FkbM family methyltransferase